MLKKLSNVPVFVFFLILIIFIPFGVLAQTDYYDGSLVPCGIQGKLCTLCHFVLLAKNIFEFFLKIALAFAILIGAIVGVMHITSSGTEALMNVAKQAIKLTLLGFLFCLLAWVMVGITAKLMGYQETWWSLEMECDDYENMLEDTRLGCDEYNKELTGAPDVTKIIEDQEGCEADEYCEYDEEEELCVAKTDDCPDGAIICDPLTNGETKGKQSGGTFTSEGWKHNASNSKITYSFPSMTSGYVSFDVTNMSESSTGGPPEYDYYFGIYDDSSGDKEADYTGAAFIEVRYNYDNGVHPPIKLNSGAGKTAHEISEEYINWGSVTFSSGNIYKHEIAFGDGKAVLSINGQKVVTSTYKGTVNWSNIYVGDTNYKGSGSFYTGMKGFAYSNVILKKSK